MLPASGLYPNLVRIYGYSSRNQSNKQAYVDLLDMRIKAKHNELSKEFLEPLNLTNSDLKTGLKLPLNAYTGTLRAPFNALYDNLQGFSICSTGQMLLLQLAHDLKEVPTVEIIELNTDACMYMIDEEYVEQAHKVLQDWQDLTGLELEQDKIKKLVMRDVNNYVEIVQTGDNDYEVHYKGGVFTGKHNFKWNKDKKCFEYSFEDDIKSNSLTICSEAVLKYLLFGTPVEETINNCNDIHRFQMINHLGSTYDKMIMEYPDGRQEELQRNNRIYAGLVPTGKIYKIKENEGRKDSLAMCPTNPIVDNDNKLTIDKINKKWYNKYTKQKISDFIGEGGVYMEEKLDKLKKDELIEMVKEYQRKEDNGEMNNVTFTELSEIEKYSRLYHKINEFRKLVRERNFVLDCELPNNLGANEYASIEQYYQAVQEICLQVGLDFSFEANCLEQFDLKAFVPSNGAPQHIATVQCIFTLTDIDTGNFKEYAVIAQGSDTIDKAVNGATTYAFRNWFNKNFSPCIWNGVKQTFGESDTPVVTEEVEKSEPKTKVYIAPDKKEEIKEEVVSTPQKSDDKEDIEKLIKLIYDYREKSGKEDAGANKLEKITNNDYSDADILSWTLSFENAIEKLGV